MAGIPRYGNRVYNSYLVLACGYGSINVYSTSNFGYYNFTVGMYLYTNPGLTIPLVTSTLGVDYVSNPIYGECTDGVGIETDSTGLVVTINGYSYVCSGCGC